MSTSPPTEREQSFAETALRLGGKTEEEARRTGALDKADEQVESCSSRNTRPPTAPSTGPSGTARCRWTCSRRRRWPRRPRATRPWRRRWTWSAAPRGRHDPRRQGQGCNRQCCKSWATPATGACSIDPKYGGQGAPFARFTHFLTRMATYDAHDRRPGLDPRLHRRRRSRPHLRHAGTEAEVPAADWPTARPCPASP